MNTPDPAVPGSPVEVSGLRKTFGTKVALAGFSLRLGRGEIFGAVGANGGGKTTALRLLAGLLPADAGQGRVLGVDLRAHPARLRTSVGYMTQHGSLYRDFTVTENLWARARIYGIAEPRQRVAELLARFDLARFAQERVGRLSGGWIRRVQFAVTLVPAPQLLLLDEPTAGLDLETGRHLWESLVELAAAGTTILVSTHDLTEAGRCDQVGVFVEGEVVAEGTVEEGRPTQRRPRGAHPCGRRGPARAPRRRARAGVRASRHAPARPRFPPRSGPVRRGLDAGTPPLARICGTYPGGRDVPVDAPPLTLP